jgi:sulfur carrier protein
VSLQVNGKSVEWVKDENIEQFLRRVKYTFPLVVVKINEKVIPKYDFLKTKIPDNSIIAVIHMISGG